jgi:hypothetical protein
MQNCPGGSWTWKPDPGYKPLCSQSGSDTALYAAARSKHSGGVQAAMADASVRFFSDGVSATTWQQLGSRAGGEPIDGGAMQ